MIQSSRTPRKTKATRSNKARQRARRRLRLEPLEDRRLLAVLFADSFEQSEWNGNWVEDGQNDWARTTQRAADGSYAAEVDGSASNATLTIANPLDLTSYGSAELTFSWYIESSFDRGEYIALDLFDGNSWNEVASLKGNVDQENVWHNETITIDGNYLVSNFQLRFRAKVSDSKEDGFVDNVKIEGTLDSAEPVGLISHWTADNNPLDVEGNNDGTPVSGASYASGQIGQAFFFDGVNDRVLVADSPSLRLTKSMTIEGWVRVDSFTSGDGMILFRGDDRGGLDPYLLRTRFDGTLQFQIQDAANNGASVSTLMPQGEFVYVAATLDDATGEMSLYLNGVRMAQKVTAVRPYGALDPNSNPGVGIGNHGGYPTTPHNFPFHGVIDELKIHDVALSEADILANFNADKGSLQPKLSIDDTSVVENAANWTFVDSLALNTVPGSGQPWGVARGPSGDIYVAFNELVGGIAGRGKIEKIDGITGVVDENFVPFGTSGLNKAREFAFQGGWIYVTSRGTHEVLRFDESTGAPDPSGAFVSASAGGLSTPRGIVFDAAGDLIVSSKGTDQLLKFSGVDGTLKSVFATNVTGGGTGPKDIALDAAGDLYVLGDDNVYKYNGVTGASLGQFVSGGLLNPSSLEFDSNGDLFVADSNAKTVLQFDGLTGDLIETIDLNASNTGITGLAFDNAGRLNVASTAPISEVRRYESVGSAIVTVQLSSPNPGTVTVNYTTDDGTANAGSDYQSTSGTLTFTPGVTAQTIQVPIIDDLVAESTEGFFVNLSASTGADIQDNQGIVTILDNEVANVPPSADAGVDQTVSDGDNSGDQSVTLNGGGSDSDGSIVSYAWTEGATVWGSTASISPTLLVGTHTLTLTVTDDEGATASDTVVVTVNPNHEPTANAGVDQSTTDGAAVTLNGSGSDSDGSIVSYQWTEGATVLGTTASIAPILSLGAHTLSLTVTDDGGATASDNVVVTVNPVVVSSTKFYVVDDSVDDMFEYEADGTPAENYNLGSGNNAPRGVAADITGNTVWVIDNDDYVYVHDNAGNLLRSWKASGLRTPEGIATDGTDVWIVDRGRDRVYCFAGGASRTTNTAATSSFSLAAGDSRGITTDGTYLWVVDAGTDDVYKYTVGGTLVGSWALDNRNSSPQGITIDPANVNDIWVIDSGDDAIYQYTGAAGRTSGSQSANAVFGLASGNTNPKGIADPPPASLPSSDQSPVIGTQPTDAIFVAGFLNATSPYASETTSLLPSDDRSASELATDIPRKPVHSEYVQPEQEDTAPFGHKADATDRVFDDFTADDMLDDDLLAELASALSIPQ